MTGQLLALEAAHDRELLWRAKAKVVSEELQALEAALRPVLAELIRMYLEYEEEVINTEDCDRIDAIIANAQRALRITA